MRRFLHYYINQQATDDEFKGSSILMDKEKAIIQPALKRGPGRSCQFTTQMS